MLSQTAVFVRRVADHMGPPPLRVAAGTPCAEVVRRLREQHATGAVVAAADGAPAGIVTEQDVCRRVAFAVEADTPVEAVMSTPLRSVREDEYLYHAIAHMRRARLRHMPVLDAGGEVVGILQLHEALAVAASQMVRHIERLTHEQTLDGMQGTKAAQVEVAAELLRDTVPAPEIQRLLTRINNDLYRRIVDLCLREMEAAGWGGPPVAFDVVVMGSGGRGESYLLPDQDNGFILEDYPDAEHARIDAWFVELAGRMTAALHAVGFEFCRGHVMATNPLWRKTLSQWRAQTTRWVSAARGQVLRLCDIFFDFVSVHGRGELTAALRRHVTGIAGHPFFLREMFKVDEEHGVALGFFGRLQTDPLEGPNKGRINLKLTGTLPLVGAVRILALRHGVPATSTAERMERLHALGVLDANEHDYLRGAFAHITYLLLRQQLEDFQGGGVAGNHVPPAALSRRERDMLVDGFKAIRALRARVRTELTAEVF